MSKSGNKNIFTKHLMTGNSKTTSTLYIYRWTYKMKGEGNVNYPEGNQQ